MQSDWTLWEFQRGKIKVSMHDSFRTSDVFSFGGGGGGQYVINSLHAMGTFMCLYKIEKTMYFILTSNIKSPYKFT